MKSKELAKAILENLPKKNRKKPKLETYDKLNKKEKKKVDKLSEELIKRLENIVDEE
jgi:hypothetical protein